MLAIRLPESIEKRLEKLARRTGRTKTYYVREAILQHLEEIEDVYLAERALERIRSGKARTIPLRDATKHHVHGRLSCPKKLRRFAGVSERAKRGSGSPQAKS